MPGKKSLVAALLTLVLAYFAYPYVTLYRLGAAIHHGDGTTLETLINWPSVREGIKEDICDLVIDESPEAKAGTQLRPFGASFVRGIATNVIDARVTPQALVTVSRRPVSRPAGGNDAVAVSWAFFASPTQFLVDLRMPEQDTPIHLQMDLRHGAWRVTRVWLPPELLGQANRPTLASSASAVHQTNIAERIQ